MSGSSIPTVKHEIRNTKRVVRRFGATIDKAYLTGERLNSDSRSLTCVVDCYRVVSNRARYID